MSGVDHRPYLVEGDLRTPEDVLAWLCEYDPREQLGDALVELRVQLRRERRQACRRGAKFRWTWFALGLREYVRRVRQEGLLSDSDALESLKCDLSLALAFRAAARQP